ALLGDRLSTQHSPSSHRGFRRPSLWGTLRWESAEAWQPKTGTTGRKHKREPSVSTEEASFRLFHKTVYAQERKKCVKICGFSPFFARNVPQGAGLSDAAACRKTMQVQCATAVSTVESAMRLVVLTADTAVAHCYARDR